jgi:hypothetical protein
MSLALAVLGIVIAAAVVALAVVLVRFNLKRRRIARIAASASSADLDSIYRLIEQTTGEPPCGCVLGRTNQPASHTRCIVLLPLGLADFPWSGRVVEIESGDHVTYRFVEPAEPDVAFAGRTLRPVLVPRVKLSSGKLRNVFSPKRLVAGSDQLASALRQLSPDSPGDLLSYLLCAGTESFEFEPIDQARIGTTPAWTQDAQWPICEHCHRRQHLILQIPGSLLSPKRNGTSYWFGCKKHPEITQVVEQFT